MERRRVQRRKSGQSQVAEVSKRKTVVLPSTSMYTLASSPVMRFLVSELTREGSFSPGQTIVGGRLFLTLGSFSPKDRVWPNDLFTCLCSRTSRETFLG